MNSLLRRLVCKIFGHRRESRIGRGVYVTGHCQRCGFEDAPMFEYGDPKLISALLNGDWDCSTKLEIDVNEIAACENHDDLLALVKRRMKSAEEALARSGHDIALSDGTNSPTKPESEEKTELTYHGHKITYDNKVQRREESEEG